MWISDLHNSDFLAAMKANLKANAGLYKTFKRLEGMLQVMSEELNDTPLYYILDRLCRTVHCQVPSMDVFCSALLNAGYKVSGSHAQKGAIKTNAPNEVVWDVLRKWVQENPIQAHKWQENDRGLCILSKKPSTEISFEIREDAIPYSKRANLLRYQENPEPNWGPKPRATIVMDDDSVEANPSKKAKVDTETTA